jgi:hypothetical protein
MSIGKLVMTENPTSNPDQPAAEDTSKNETGKIPETPFGAFLYHQRLALEEAAKAVQALIPPDFKVHSKEARSQFVEGFRVLVNSANEALARVEKMNTDADAEKPAEQPRPKTTGKAKIKVEVN